MVLCLVKIWRVPELWEEIRGHCYVEKNLAAMCACEMTSDLPACIHVWPCKPHPYTETSLSSGISQIFFRSLVMQFWGWHTQPHFLVLLQTRVESGSPLLLQPFQFKVKWCVHSEMAFCTLLVYWDVIYLACWTRFATHSSGRGGNSESSKRRPVIMFLPFLSGFVLNYQVNKWRRNSVESSLKDSSMDLNAVEQHNVWSPKVT